MVSYLIIESVHGSVEITGMHITGRQEYNYIYSDCFVRSLDTSASSKLDVPGDNCAV